MKVKVYVILLLSSFALNAQNKISGSKNFYIRVIPSRGFIFEHHSYVAHLVKGYTTGLSIEYVKPTYGNKKWQHQNNLPDVGMSLGFLDYGNPKQLGQCYSLAPFIDFPLRKTTRSSRVIFRLLWGVGYVTKKFDIDHNSKNIMIGSHWNTYVQYKWYWAFNASKKLRIEPGIAFSHASNGRAQVPNLGINVVSFNLGITYKFLKEEEARRAYTDSSSFWPTKHEILVWGALGFNEMEPPGGKKYMAYTLGVNYYYNKNDRHKFGGGVDFDYDLQNFQHLENSGDTAKNWYDILTVGPKFCYAYNVGGLSFPVEMGVYAISKPKEDGLFFHRIGIRYYCKNGLMINFSLKSHWGVAAHFDYGLGYRFGIKKRKLKVD